MKAKLVLCFLFLISARTFAQVPQNTAARSQSPVPMDRTGLSDEKGNVDVRRPALFSIYLGNQFTLPNATAVDSATSLVNSEILRTNETTYTASGVNLQSAPSSFTAQPALRIEWEIPFERIGILPAWRTVSLIASLEGGLNTASNLLSASGDFRYLNPQANHVALTDVTYNGQLNVTEKSYRMTPMLGIGLEYTNPTLKGAGDLRFLLRLAGGLALQSSQRKYTLNVDPKSISAGAYSDSYTIQSSITQSYAMAFLPAGRVELGARMRVGSRLHLTIMGSFTAIVGVQPFENTGNFSEVASGSKITFQKIIANAGDETFIGLIPAAFLALSLEI